MDDPEFPTSDERDGPRGPGSRRRRSRQRPIPEDVAHADTLEDGHERVIDPREAGAEIWTENGLDLEEVDPDALKVLRRLNRYGFQAYLVGGCVRDLLIGRHPKDFDIATSATPKQIKKLFRNSRIIGRRFRLAHIHFGDNILEVSTFRAAAVAKEEDDADPLIVRDNVFGRADEDARRRDFTVNALFFDIRNLEVIDFVGGMKDLRAHRIETIGDPVTRLREDPVRMLRAARFAGRLGFDLAEDLFRAIAEVNEDLRKAAAPRLYEELQKLLDRGGARGSFDILHRSRVLDVLLPELAAHVDGPPSPLEIEPAGLWSILRSLDIFVDDGHVVSNVVLLSALFLPLFERALLHNGPPPEGEKPSDFDIGALVDRILDPIALRLQVPRRDLFRVKQILAAQRRFLARKQGRRKPSPKQVVRKEYFPDALRLFQIHARALGRFQPEVERWMGLYEEAYGRPF